MMYLLFGILNLILIGLLFYGCFKATVKIRQKLGAIAALLFVFVLLAFATASRKNQQIEKFDIPTTLAPGKTISPVDIVLEKSVVSTFILHLVADGNTKVKAFSTYTEFVSGIEWKPAIIKAAKKDTGLQYEVIGVVKWKLAGITFYSEPKTFTGIAALN